MIMYRYEIEKNNRLIKLLSSKLPYTIPINILSTHFHIDYKIVYCMNLFETILS